MIFHNKSFVSLLKHHKTINIRLNLLSKLFTHKKVSESHTGLFSIKEIQKPINFIELSHKAIEKCNNIRQILHRQLMLKQQTQIVRYHVVESKDILRLLDSLSNVVCNVIDVAELCRNVHMNPEYIGLSC